MKPMETQTSYLSKSGDARDAKCCGKDHFCPGCCDLCTGKCNRKKALVSVLLFIASLATLFALDAILLNGELWSMIRSALGLGSCGWLVDFGDKESVCVEVPPKVVEEGRRLRRNLRRLGGNETGIHVPTAQEQSMSFYCSDSAGQDCTEYCSAQYIYIKQVFLVEDEFDDRQSWSGFHIRVVINEEAQSFDMDFALGCDGGEDEYLSQTFSDSSFECGYSEIGYDLYTSSPVSSCAQEGGGGCESDNIDGKTHYYMTMDNLIFGPDLQEAILAVKDGSKLPGVYTKAYPKSYDHIVPGCTAEYKVDFVIPERYAPTETV